MIIISQKLMIALKIILTTIFLFLKKVTYTRRVHLQKIPGHLISKKDALTYKIFALTYY